MSNFNNLRKQIRKFRWFGFNLGYPINAPFILPLRKDLTPIRGFENINEFDGVNDYVDCSIPTITSFEIKIKPTREDIEQIILSGSVDTYFIFQRSNNNFTLNTNGDNEDIIAIEFNEWQTLKGINDGSKWSFYKNDIFIKDSVLNTTKSDILTIGARSSTKIAKFKGEIEYLKTYSDTALTTFISYYDLKNNATYGLNNVKDLSGNGNHGTSYGKGEFSRSTSGTQTDHNGNLNEVGIDIPRHQGARYINDSKGYSEYIGENVMVFDGNDRVLLQPIQNLGINYSIMFNGKPNSLDLMDSLALFENNRLYNRFDSGTFSFRHFDTITSKTLTTTYSENKNYNIIVSVINGVLNLYKNGVLVDTDNGIINMDSVSDGDYIGYNGALSSNYFKGVLDNPVIWETGLTSEEVFQQYQYKKKGSDYLVQKDNVVSAWKLDDTTSEIIDYIGDNNGVFYSSGSPDTPTLVEGVFDSDTRISSDVLKGILVEEARTNLLTYSEELDNITGGWTEASITSSLNQDISPDGNLTADRIIPDTGTGSRGFSKAGVLVDNTIYAFSIFVKKNDYQWVRLATRSKTGTVSSTWFDVENAVVGTQSSNHIKAYFEDYNNYYRIIVTTDAKTGVSDPRFYVRLADDDNDSDATGDGIKYNTFWGAQLEASSFSSSYVKTESTSVSRTKDIPKQDVRDILETVTTTPSEVIEDASYYLPLQTDILPDTGDITPLFSRATAGTITDFEGALHTSKIDEARFGGARRVENLIEKSEDFEDDVWVKTRIDINATDILAPNETNTATHYIQSDGETAAGVLTHSGISYAQNCVLSVYAKKAELNWVNLYTKVGGQRTYFDLDNGVVGTVANIHTNATIEDVGNGWYRCSVTTTNANVDRTGFYLAEANDGTTIDPQEVGIYVWGAQLERISGSQTSASEYISTGVSVQTGSEEVTNGGFDTDSDWTKGTGWTISGGSANANNATSFIYQDLSATGKNLIVTFDVNHISGVGVSVRAGSVLGDIINVSGTYRVLIKADGALFGFIGRGAGWTGSIDNVSVKEEYYHGANVDGVKYLNTDRAGVAIPNSDLKGLLNEPAGTNLITYSEDFSNAVWTKDETTQTSNQILAPDGTLTADKIIDDATTDYHVVYSNLGSIDTSITRTYSIYLKNNDRRYVTVSAGRAGLVDSIAVLVDLENGTITETQEVGDGILDSYSIIELYNDWYKVTITGTISTTTDVVYFLMGLSNRNTFTGDEVAKTPRYLGDGSSIYIWGADIKEGNFPTSYIKTLATTVTRTADSLTVDNTARDVLPNSFCLAGTWTPLGDGADYVLTDIRLSGSQDSRGQDYEHRTGSTGATYFYAKQSGGEAFVISNVDLNQSIQNKYAFQVFQDGANVNVKIFKDGVQKLSEVEIQTLDHSNENLELGSWAGTVFACYIRDINIYNEELSDTELAIVTSDTSYEYAKGSLALEFNTLGADASDTPYMISISDETASNYIGIYGDEATQELIFKIVNDDGSSGEITTTGDKFTYDAQHKAMITYGKDKNSFYLDGVKIGESLDGTVPIDLTTLYEGNLNESNQANATIKDIKYYKKILSESTAKVLTRDVPVYVLVGDIQVKVGGDKVII